MIEALAGTLVAALTIVLARFFKAERWFYALDLLSLPGVYAFYALRAGDHAAVAKALAWGVPYFIAGLACAFIHVRRSAVLVGGLWLLHAFYDLVEGPGFTHAGGPSWYPIYCIAVDIVIGAYLLWLSRRLTNADLRLA